MPPNDANWSRTDTQARRPSAVIQSSLPKRRGRSASHQTMAKVNANGANVSFEKVPGMAQSGKRYQRAERSDQATSARKNASPESMYAARFQLGTAKLTRKSNAPMSE